MKKYIILISCTVMLFSFAGCQKFLNESFDNRLELLSVSDFAELTRNSYPTKYDIFTEVLTDNHYIYPTLMQSAWKSLYTPIYLYNDEYEYALNYASPATSYTHFYSKIYTANYVIENIRQATGGTQEKQAVLAEALLIRAYSYFVLTNLFSMHFNDGTASTDLAVPLVLEVNKENRPIYKRATVKEVYDQIEIDLYTAIGIYESNPSFVPTNPYQFSGAAAYAFACRLNLYKSNYEKAIEYADKVFAAKGIVLRDMVKDYNQLLSFGWPYYDNQKNDPSTHPNIIMSSQNAYIHHVVGNNWGGFFIDRTLRAKITDTDHRRRYKVNAGTVIDDCTYMRKNTADWSTSRYIMFSTEEILLSRAEAYLKINIPNREKALEDIETLRRTRYSPFVALSSTISESNLLTEIMLQRQIELISEGLRWYDIKRLGIEVYHKLDVNSTTVDVALKVDDPRTALQIPVNARIGNPELENQLNPR